MVGYVASEASFKMAHIWHTELTCITDLVMIAAIGGQDLSLDGATPPLLRLKRVMVSMSGSQ